MHKGCPPPAEGARRAARPPRAPGRPASGGRGAALSSALRSAAGGRRARTASASRPTQSRSACATTAAGAPSRLRRACSRASACPPNPRARSEALQRRATLRGRQRRASRRPPAHATPQARPPCATPRALRKALRHAPGWRGRARRAASLPRQGRGRQARDDLRGRAGRVWRGAGAHQQPVRIVLAQRADRRRAAAAAAPPPGQERAPQAPAAAMARQHAPPALQHLLARNLPVSNMCAKFECRVARRAQLMQAVRDLAHAACRGAPSERWRRSGRQGVSMSAAMLPEAHTRRHASMPLGPFGAAGCNSRGQWPLAQPVTARGPCHTARRTAAPGSAQRAAAARRRAAPSRARVRSSLEQHIYIGRQLSVWRVLGTRAPSVSGQDPGPQAPAGAGRTSSAGAAASAAPSSVSSSSSEPGWWPSACSRIAAFFSAAAAATPGRGRPSAGLRAAAARWGGPVVRRRGQYNSTWQR